MAKFFTFSSRICNVRFFDGDNEVVLALKIGDKTDAKIVDCYKAILKADSGSVDGKAEKVRTALDALIGSEKVDEIMAKCPDEQDSYALMQVYEHIKDCYREEKVKNLSGSPAK